jgi:hypothetical protein
MTQDEFFRYVESKGEENPELETKFYETLQNAITIGELSRFNAEWKERYFWSVDNFEKRNGSSLN